MINSFRINESVLDEMRRAGVGRKPLIETEGGDYKNFDEIEKEIRKTQKTILSPGSNEKSDEAARKKIKALTDHPLYRERVGKEKSRESDRTMQTYESKMSELDLERQEKAIKAKAEKAKAKKEDAKPVKEETDREAVARNNIKKGQKYKVRDTAPKQFRGQHVTMTHVGRLQGEVDGVGRVRVPRHLLDHFEPVDENERSVSRQNNPFAAYVIKEGEDEKEGLEDKQFDAPTGKEISDLDKKNAGIDQDHDEAGEEQDDPTREKLETPQDEKDEQKGGAAELAADLRVSVRIERMNMGRYKKMLDKHDLSEDGQGWLKEKIQDIQSMIDDMLERIPQLEKEAEEQSSPEEAKVEMQEHMRSKLRKAIVEIAG